jgi:hypothetical protein
MISSLLGPEGHPCSHVSHMYVDGYVFNNIENGI